MNKHITGNVLFLRQLFQNNHNLVLADSAQAASSETPASSSNTAIHCTLHAHRATTVPHIHSTSAWGPQQIVGDSYADDARHKHCCGRLQYFTRDSVTFPATMHHHTHTAAVSNCISQTPINNLRRPDHCTINHATLEWTCFGPDRQTTAINA